MPTRRWSALVVAALGLATPPLRATAQTVPIANGSFEYNALSDGQFRAPVTGWDAFLGNESYGSFHPTTYAFADGLVPDGANVLFLNPGVGLLQTLDAVLRADATYTLSYAVGQRGDVLGGPYAVEVLAGTTVVARDPGSLLPAPGEFVSGRLTFAASAFQSAIGERLQLRVLSTGDGQPVFDDFALAVDPPEPWVPIRNASFEENALAEGQFRAPVTGWDAFAGNESYGAYNPTSYSFPDGDAPDGANVLFLNPGSGIRQTLDAVLRPDAEYTLAYSVGQRADVPSGPYRVELLAGTTVLARDDGFLAPTAGAFLPGSLRYTADAFGGPIGQPLEIRVTATGDGQAILDAFSLHVDPVFRAQTIAPEPHGWTLLGAGLLGLAVVGRRRPSR